MPIDYQNSRLYKLVNTVDNKIYVGATTTMLCKRMAQHRSAAKININRPVYKHLNDIGWQYVSIELIKKFPCADKDELHKEERRYIELLHASLNKIIPTRTKREYYEDNIEHIKQYCKKNNDIINKKQKEKIKCVCGRHFSRTHRLRHLKSKIHEKLISEKEQVKLLKS